ncbi:MAG: hypothetical protein ACI89L_001660 [Phycisphaerales bacterium]|jgi:hypothetical protein
MPPETTKSALKTASQLLDMDFLEHRAKLIDLAAFLDRLDRAADGPEASKQDFRATEFIKALAILSEPSPGRAARVLEALSDPSTIPIDKAPEKGAHGAWQSEPQGGTA